MTRLAVAAVSLLDGTRINDTAAERMVAASLIKLPILLTVLDLVDAGALSLDRSLPIAPAHRVGGSGWLGARTDLPEVALSTLVTAMVDASDNTATNVLIAAVGMDAINVTCQQLGLSSTRLARRMMDVDAARAGRENYTSAADVVTLLEKLARGTILTPATRRVALDALLGQQIKGRLDRHLPDGLVLAHKTGELVGIRHDAGILLRDRTPLAVVAVLSVDGPDDESADTLVADRAREVYAELGLT